MSDSNLSDTNLSDSQSTCCFCLGSDVDIPPFGDLVDAHDFVNPCSTCKIQSHRKCLVEWFNSLPSEKLQVVNAESITDVVGPDEDSEVSGRVYINLSPSLIQQWLGNLSIGYDAGVTNRPSGELPTISPPTINTPILTVTLPPNPESHEHFESTPTLVSSTMKPSSMIAFLIAPCPQCKLKIVFSMKRSSLLAFQSGLRTLITRVITYGGIFLGITSAITGVVSMGYVGLTTCGLKMMDLLVPGPLLVLMLTRKAPNGVAVNGYNTLSQLLLGNVNNYAIENLETALVKGLIDPFKFSRIPVLPIVLYRQRSTSIISCLFAKNRDISFNNWIAEFMLDGYISSLGNHELVRSMVANFQSQLSDIIRNPALLSQGINLFKGVNFWKTSNMISMLIPTRWIYDLLFRLTFNQAHFNLTLGIRPRVITNSLSQQEGDKLEILNNQIGTLKYTYKIANLTVSRQVEREGVPTILRNLGIPLLNSIYKLLKHKLRMYNTLYKINFPFNYIKYRVQMWIHKAGACIVNDYSTSLLNNSTTLRVFTTVLWPYFSSKLGQVVFKLIVKRIVGNDSSVSEEKLLLLSNMIGLVGVVFIKDLVNLFLSYKKASQISKMVVLRRDHAVVNQEDTEETDAPPRPGLFSWFLTTNNSQANLSGDVVNEVAEVVNLYLNMRENDLMSSWTDEDIAFPGGYPN